MEKEVNNAQVVKKFRERLENATKFMLLPDLLNLIANYYLCFLCWHPAPYDFRFSSSADFLDARIKNNLHMNSPTIEVETTINYTLTDENRTMCVRAPHCFFSLRSAYGLGDMIYNENQTVRWSIRFENCTATMRNMYIGVADQLHHQFYFPTRLQIYESCLRNVCNKTNNHAGFTFKYDANLVTGILKCQVEYHGLDSNLAERTFVYPAPIPDLKSAIFGCKSTKQ